VSGRDDGIELLGEGFDGVAWPEPGGGEVVALQQLVEARHADLAREDTSGDVTGRVLTPIGPEPSADCVDVDAEGDEDFFCHWSFLLIVRVTRDHRSDMGGVELVL
jgi:hypothetical protein